MLKTTLSLAALSAALLSTPFAAQAQTASTTPRDADQLDEIVVTATRASQGVRRDTLGASVTLIEAEDLEVRQTRLISDVLRDVPGVAVNRTGTVGGLTQVRVRGTEGNHVLVLIDGMEAADPYYGEFDFATLIADDVARVEVLRGQQSALYGSDAIGGVIHYITASGAEAPGVRGRVEYGSFNSLDVAVRAAGVAGLLDYAVSAGRQSTDGIATARQGVRDLGADNTVLSGRFVLNLADNLRLRAIGRYAETNADTNPQDFTWGSPTYGYVIDGDERFENTGAYGLVSAEWEGLDGRWGNALTLQGIDGGRDSFSGGARSSGSEGSRFKASYVSSLRFGSDAFAQTLTGAVDFERENFQNTGPGLTADQGLRRRIETVGLVAQYDLVVNGRLSLGAALRHDDNDRFDSAATYRAQGAYRFDTGTRVHAAAGSGVKNPSMTELFGFNPGTFIGNPDLKPERSQGWEAGVEQTLLGGRARLSLTYFDSTLKDEIYTDYIYVDTPPPGAWWATPGNRATDSTQRGVELSAQARLGDAWTLHGAYTYLDAEENGVEEVRRPPHIASVNVSWRAPGDAYGAFVTVRYNGETLDNDYTASPDPRVTMPAFTLVNVGGDLRLNDTLSLYGRVENLFDEEYEEVFTFRAPGRAAYIGLRAGF